MVGVELKRLIAAGIIYPVDKPAISAPIVPVVKQSAASRPIRNLRGLQFNVESHYRQGIPTHYPVWKRFCKK